MWIFQVESIVDQLSCFIFDHTGQVFCGRDCSKYNWSVNCIMEVLLGYGINKGDNKFGEEKDEYSKLVSALKNSRVQVFKKQACNYKSLYIFLELQVCRIWSSSLTCIQFILSYKVTFYRHKPLFTSSYSCRWGRLQTHPTLFIFKLGNGTKD